MNTFASMARASRRAETAKKFCYVRDYLLTRVLGLVGCDLSRSRYYSYTEKLETIPASRRRSALA